MARNSIHNDSSTKKNVRPADGLEERWVYMGRRPLQGGKVGHTWLDPQGEQLVYDKVKAAVIGGVYEIDVIREGDGVRVYKNTVKFIERSGHADTGKWEIEDKAAYAEQQRRAIERKVVKEDKQIGDMTLKQIAAMIRKAPSQRSALIATVINEINFGDLW